MKAKKLDPYRKLKIDPRDWSIHLSTYSASIRPTGTTKLRSDYPFNLSCMIFLLRLKGLSLFSRLWAIEEEFEHPTPWFVAMCSNPLSYSPAHLHQICSRESQIHNFFFFFLKSQIHNSITMCCLAVEMKSSLEHNDFKINNFDWPTSLNMNAIVMIMVTLFSFLGLKLLWLVYMLTPNRHLGRN